MTRIVKKKYFDALANDSLLSQVIGNLLQSNNTLKDALKNSSFLQSDRINSLSSSLSDCCTSFISLQKDLCTFVKDVSNSLSSILNASTIASDDLEKVQITVSNQIDKIKSFTNLIMATSSTTEPALEDLKKQFLKYNTDLTEVKLKLEDAEKQAKKYNDQKYYFLALGILGLAGLATAIGLLVTWQKKADSYKTEQMKLSRIVKQIDICQSTISTLQKDCSDTINQLSHVSNTINIIISNIKNVKENLEHTEIVKLFIRNNISVLNNIHTMVA